MDNLGLTFPILLDQIGTVYLAYRLPFCLSPFPQDYIIDQNGLIAYEACEFFPDSMASVIDSLLAQGASVGDEDFMTDVKGPRIEFIQPNPIATGGRIIYVLPEDARARVDVVDVSGRRVRTLMSAWQRGGPQTVVWDGRDAAGRLVPAGSYFVRVASRGRVASGRVSVVR